jgi:hypothetical protein
MSDSASEPNETQERGGEEDEETKDQPSDVGWDETQDQPHQGEEGQDIV